MKKTIQLLTICLIFMSNLIFANSIDTNPDKLFCNVLTSTTNGGIKITGLTNSANTKLFTADFGIVWECNPWLGSPCNPIENITGLNVGETYYLSIVSDDCQEWIPITVEGGGGYNLTLECPFDILTPIIPAGQTTIQINWADPTAYTTCPSGQTVVNQMFGPNSGDPLSVGTYGVIWEAFDDCGNITTCDMLIEVTATDPICNINVIKNPSVGEITVTGLTATTNAKLFTGDFTSVWECNPWNGYSCSNNEVIPGLTAGETYYLSVVSEVCEEWIPVDLDDANECFLQGTITNCFDQNIGGITYDIYVEGTNTSGSTFTMPISDLITDGNTITLAYNTTHTISEFASIFEFSKTVWDTDNPSCTTTIQGNCELTPIEVTIPNCPDDITTFIPSGQAGIPVSWTAPYCYSNCFGDVIACSIDQVSGPAIGDFLIPGIYTVEYEAYDECGNVATCSFNIDVIPDGLECSIEGSISNCTVDNNSISTYDIFVTNSFNSGPTFTMVINDPVVGPQGITLAYNQTHTISEYYGDLTINKAVFDASNPICTTNILAPCEPFESEVIIQNCPNDIYVSIPTELGGRVVNWEEPFCTSTCAGDGEACYLNIVSGPQNGDFLAIGEYTVMYEATDGCSNISVCSFNIIVSSIPNQVIIQNCPNDIYVTIPSDIPGDIVTWSEPFCESTFCPNDGLCVMEIISGPQNGSYLTEGSYTVTYRATDACDDVAFCSFDIVVSTLQNEVIIQDCPEDIFIMMPAGSSGYPVAWPEPSCESTFCPNDGLCYMTIVDGPANGSFLAEGSYTVTYLATDSCDDVAYCTFNITITTEQNEVIIKDCPDDIVVTIPADVPGDIVSWQEPFCESTACPLDGLCVMEIVDGPQNGSYLTEGTYNVTYLATDACGDIAYCSFEIKVTTEILECNVFVDSYSGIVGIWGLPADANTKIFDTDFNVVWECNPWNGNPCHNSVEIYHLFPSGFFYLSVQSDICDEWISFFVTEALQCRLTPTISNISCTSNTITYDIYVEGIDSSPYYQRQVSTEQGYETQFFQINQTHTITEYISTDPLVHEWHVLVTDPQIPVCFEGYAYFSCNWTCDDADSDGVCDIDDCQPNNPALPGFPGEPCNDFDESTLNDEIQPDGCTCMGYPTPMPDGATSSKLGTITSNANQVSITNAFPNPAIGELFVTIDSQVDGEFQVEVYDIMGSKFLSKPVLLDSGKNTVELNVSELSDGIYNLVLMSKDEQVRSIRFVKSN